MALRPYDDIWSSPRRRFQDPIWDPTMTSRDLMTSSSDWMTPYHGRREMMPFRHRSERFTEMERKFEEMVRKVDSRFSGIFSLLDDDDFFGRQKVEVEHEGKQTTVSTSKPKDFSLKLDVQDFRPEEVKVKVQGGQVYVHAKRENKNEGDDMYAYSYREFKRAFTLPQGVDAERLTSSLTNAGVLQIDAPVINAPAIEAPRTAPVPVTVEHGDK